MVLQAKIETKKPAESESNSRQGKISLSDTSVRQTSLDQREKLKKLAVTLVVTLKCPEYQGEEGT